MAATAGLALGIQSLVLMILHFLSKCGRIPSLRRRRFFSARPAGQNIGHFVEELPRAGG
jgi:hypothetical protein